MSSDVDAGNTPFIVTAAQEYIRDTLASLVLERAVSIQQIPAPTHMESQRAAYIQAALLREGLREVELHELGNVFARLPGRGSGLPLVVSAHSDTVFPLDTDLTVRRAPDKIFGAGIGDNALGVAGLFGLLWALQQGVIELPGDIWLVANVCEEGLGDLRGMRAVVDRFGAGVRAYLVLEGMALGQIYHQGLGVQRYRISASTVGGHSWVDYGRPSAIHELAALVSRLVSLSLPRKPRTSLNVGVFSGGTSVNTIAPTASFELDLRSESERVLKNLVERVLACVKEASRPDVNMQAELIGSRPQGKISPEHPLVGLARRCLEEQGLQPHLSIGSTDANVPLSRGLPAVCVGLTTGQGAHTREEYINTAPLAQGLAQLLNLVQGAFAVL